VLDDAAACKAASCSTSSESKAEKSKPRCKEVSRGKECIAGLELRTFLAQHENIPLFRRGSIQAHTAMTVCIFDATLLIKYSSGTPYFKRYSIGFTIFVGL